MNRVLSGVSNVDTFENSRRASGFLTKRFEVPLLSASTLLVPGYVGADEVKETAAIMAEIDKRMPYSLLAFYPNYLMDDLPSTDRRTATLSIDSAREQGLEQVTLGNVHLLS